MKKIKKTFITGLVVLIPLVGTLSIIIWTFLKIDELFQQPILAITGKRFMGLGFIITLGIIFLSGLLATNYAGKKIINYIEETLNKIPIVNVLYSSIKQLQNTIFLKKNQHAFKSVVLVQYPSKDIYTIGFITANAPALIEGKIGKKLTSIFIPTTPNPTSGMFVMIPDKNMTHLNMPVDTAIKLIVSAGILSPDFSAKLNAYEHKIINETNKKQEQEGDDNET